MSIVSTKIDAVAQNVLSQPKLVKSLNTGVILGIAVLTGVAGCLRTWVIPVIRSARTTRTKTQQFRMVINLGFRFLEPLLTAAALTLPGIGYLCSRSEIPGVASKWKYYAAAAAMMVSVAPFERAFIFPTNDKLFELDDELQSSGKENFGDERDQEVDSLLVKWNFWHTGRVLAPFAAASVLAWNTTGLWSL